MYGLPKNVRVVLVISSHSFCLCLSMSKVISSFRSLRAGSRVFALLMLFLCVILNTMSTGKSLLLLCLLPFGILCSFVIRIMFLKFLFKKNNNNNNKIKNFFTIYMLVDIMVGAKADVVFSVNCVLSAFL